MAKLAFSKLNKIKSIPDKIIPTENGDLVVKQYLPLENKIDLIETVLDFSGSDEGFFNVIKLEAYFRIEMIKAYTNITFTEKQLEDTQKLYDMIAVNGIWAIVESNIPEEEKDYIWDAIIEMADAIVEYNRSIGGMLKSLSYDYSALDDEAVNIQKKLKTPEMEAVLKHFLPEAGLSD